MTDVSPPAPARADRTRTLLRAQAVTNKGASTIDCVVRNLSTTGARLEISDATALPSRFELLVPHRGRTYQAKVVWRGDDVVGVHFLGREDQAADAEDPAAKIYRLETENKQLRAKLKKAQARLAQLEDMSSGI